MNLKLKHYNNLESNLNELVKIFNHTKLNDIAAQYVSGQPVNDVNTAIGASAASPLNQRADVGARRCPSASQA